MINALGKERSGLSALKDLPLIHYCDYRVFLFHLSMLLPRVQEDSNLLLCHFPDVFISFFFPEGLVIVNTLFFTECRKLILRDIRIRIVTGDTSN